MSEVNLKKYQIVEEFLGFRHAGSKAKNDVARILSQQSFIELHIRQSKEINGFLSKLVNQLSYFFTWSNIFFVLENHSYLIRQHPVENRQFGRSLFLQLAKRFKKIKIIALVHDVNLIRYDPDLIHPRILKEFRTMLALSDVIIIHNEKMREWFIDYGVPSEKLHSLKIFDYLLGYESKDEVTFSKNVHIAGNLSKDKSPYVHLLDSLNDVSFKLLGVNYESDQKLDNVEYLGSFDPDDVPNHLKNGFGLVWDGDSIDTCSGLTGNYLRYNNPHKLSLYLASGIPVIVWKESAEADYVLQNGVGIVVDSLYELSPILESLTEEDYYRLLVNVRRISEKIQTGQYLTEVVEEILDNTHQSEL